MCVTRGFASPGRCATARLPDAGEGTTESSGLPSVDDTRAWQPTISASTRWSAVPRFRECWTGVAGWGKVGRINGRAVSLVTRDALLPQKGEPA